MVAAIRPKSYGSSTIGVKKSTVETIARSSATPVDGGVVGCLRADQQSGVVGARQLGQQRVQDGRRDLAGAPGAVGQGGELGRGVHRPIIRAVPERSFTDAEVDAALEALSDPERFREAEAHVARLAPQLQRILNAGAAGGRLVRRRRATRQLRQALAGEDPPSASAQVATLLAEETRIGMLVGVAVGWALAQELEGKRDA